MTTIKLDDPTVDLIVKNNGLDIVTKEVLKYIKIKFSPIRNHKSYDNIEKKIKNSVTKNKKVWKDFLALTSEIKDNLTKNYTVQEAKKEYLDSKI